jgi:hypothetical protein
MGRTNSVVNGCADRSTNAVHEVSSGSDAEGNFRNNFSFWRFFALAGQGSEWAIAGSVDPQVTILAKT